jgi:hypothetical protein
LPSKHNSFAARTIKRGTANSRDQMAPSRPINVTINFLIVVANILYRDAQDTRIAALIRIGNLERSPHSLPDADLER